MSPGRFFACDKADERQKSEQKSLQYDAHAESVGEQPFVFRLGLLIHHAAATIMEFYQANGISRSVGSRVESKYYGFKSLLSIKYSFIPTSDTKKHDTVGFVYFDTQNGFDIYENQYYLGMGFAFDQFMTQSDYEKIAKSQRHILFNKYLVVPAASRNARRISTP